MLYFKPKQPTFAPLKLTTFKDTSLSEDCLKDRLSSLHCLLFCILLSQLNSLQPGSCPTSFHFAFLDSKSADTYYLALPGKVC